MLENIRSTPKNFNEFTLDRDTSYKAKIQLNNALIDSNNGNMPELYHSDSEANYYQGEDKSTIFRVYKTEEGNPVLQQGSFKTMQETIDGPSVNLDSGFTPSATLAEGSVFKAEGSVMWISKDNGGALRGTGKLDFGTIEASVDKGAIDIKKSLGGMEGEFEHLSEPTCTWDASGNLHASIKHIGVKATTSGGLLPDISVDDDGSYEAEIGIPQLKNLKMTFGSNSGDAALLGLSESELETAGIDACDNDIEVFKQYNNPTMEGSKPIPFASGKFDDNIEALEGRKSELAESQALRGQTLEQYNARIDNMDIDEGQKQFLKDGMHDRIDNAPAGSINSETFTNENNQYLENLKQPYSPESPMPSEGTAGAAPPQPTSQTNQNDNPVVEKTESINLDAAGLNNKAIEISERVNGLLSKIGEIQVAG